MFVRDLLGVILPGVTARRDDGAMLVASGKRLTFTATIANGASLSDEVDLSTASLGLIVLPAALDGTALTFQVSADEGVTWNNLYEADGTEYSVTVAASRAVVPDLTMFAAVGLLKVRTGTAAAPSVQSAERSITLQTLA